MNPRSGDFLKIVKNNIASEAGKYMNSNIKNIEIFELGSKGKENSSPWSSTILIARLTSNDGTTGYGEAPTTFSTMSVKESMEEVRRSFLGKDFFNVEKNLNDLYRDSFYLSKSFQHTAALSAFEIASWDMIGKELGSPVYNLIGGKMRDTVKAYANGWYSNCTTADQFVTRAKQVVAKGFRAMKFDPFGDAFDTISIGQLNNAESIVSSMRNQLGESVDLLIECHGRFSLNAAERVAKAMEKYNVLFIEEPLHPELEHALPVLRSKSKIPIALGERLLNKADFAKVISEDKVDIIQPDVTNSLGILEGKKIAAIADSFGIPVAFHNAFGPVQTAATLNLDVTLRNFLIQESFESFWPDWKAKLLKTGYKLESGFFKLSGKNGLGIEIDDKIMESSIVQGMEPYDPKEPPWVVSDTFKSKD